MKIYTNSNNTSTLKLLIAANLAGKRVELVDASFEDDVFAGPRALPFLEVDDNLSFFASNAAVQYLFPILDLSENGQCQQMLEWEATRLHPAVSTVLSSKSVASDLKQTLQVLLITLNGTLLKHQYVLGDKLSAVDISLWSTLYPVYDNYDLKQTYMAGCDSIIRWIEELGSAKAIQDAVIEWGGSITGPFGATSVLGIPQVGSLATPVCSPSEEQPEVGPTAEEIVAAKENWENGLENLQAPLKQEKLVLPVKGRKNILITSSLPYVNNVPHLGNIIGCVLSADIFARYCRLCDYNTLYICGTDEYGTATETKALEEGVTPREICDKYFEQHNSVYRWFNIGFDYFGRTSTPQQTKIAQEMFLKLRNNGFVTSQSVDQLFCENCQKFLADRFVEGTCPHPGCGYDGARGDQCDKCGKLINATELLLPRCKTCSNTPVVRPSEQLFIELGLLEPAIRAWVNKVDMHWSPSARAVTRAWLKEHLRPRAVTRDLKWGVPVPLEGYQNKVFYVWFDAPIGYMSITENATKQYETWWKHDKEYDVTLYQFMAKDNVPFHAIMFPATLLGINEGHVIVSRIFATEYLNYEDGKFSKSRGVGVFGNDAQETGIPADVWRFYLASVRPETSDSSFSWTELGTRNNSELLNNLGNFCHRSLSFCANTFKGKVPDLVLTQADYELIALVNREVIAYVQHLEKGRLREALRHVMSVSRLGNQHMQAEQPWVLLKGSDDDKQRGATAIGLCCQLVALLCTLLSPYMPDTTRKLREQLKIDATNLRINPLNPSLIQYLPSGHVIGKPEPLFAKIEADVLDKLRAKYAGSQSDRTDRENKQNGVAEAPVSGANVAELEAAIAEQGNKVRELKSSTKDKSVWQPEVNKLLDLKKQLAAVQAGAKDASNQNANANLTPAAAAPAPGDTAEQLEKAIAEQGDKVRKLKASTNDKSAWQAELILLLDLKKRLAALNGEVMAPAPEVVAAEAHAAAAAAEGRSDEKVNARPIPPLVAPIPVRPALMPANAAFMPAPAALMPAPAALMPAPAALMPAHAARMLAPAAPMFDPAAPMLAPAAPMFAPAARMLAPAAPMFAPAARMLAPAAPMFDPAAPMFDPAAHMLAPAAHMFAPVAPMPAPAAPMLAPAAPMPDPAPPMQAPAPILLAPVPAVFNADVPIPVVQTMSHLKKAITKQGNKLRKMKESTKDKWVWQAQLILLLDLEERLATLQLN